MARKFPKKKKWPKGLKRRLRKLEAKERAEKRYNDRVKENKRIESEIKAAQKKVSK